jgi:hypothetical protein
MNAQEAEAVSAMGVRQAGRGHLAGTSTTNLSLRNIYLVFGAKAKTGGLGRIVKYSYYLYSRQGGLWPTRFCLFASRTVGPKAKRMVAAVPSCIALSCEGGAATRKRA